MATFLTSEQSSVRVTFYRKATGALSVVSGSLPMDGARFGSKAPYVTSLSTQNALGQGGKFVCTLKVPPGFDVLNELSDDDWVDIELGRHGVYWHVLRGLVDEVRQNTSVSGNGTTVSDVTVVGSSFQKVWDTTPIWFSGMSTSNNIAQAKLANWSHIEPPDSIVLSFLRKYTELLASFGRANWDMPPGLAAKGETFSKLWLYDTSGFEKVYLARRSININYLFVSGNVWQACNSWADPQYCELFTEILPKDGLTGLSADPDMVLGLPTDVSTMAVVFRDKPYVIGPHGAAPRSKRGLSSPFFQLPHVKVPRNHLVGTDLGKSGYERYNAFFSGIDLNDTNGVTAQSIATPLWSPRDMARHGMRRMDANSRYIGKELFYNSLTGGLDGYISLLRSRLRDWYCLNPTYLQGTLRFGRALPQLKVGTRLSLTDTGVVQSTYYVEQVSHTYSPAQGIRTTVGVTRGYRGTDTDHLKHLTDVISTYELGTIK